MSIRTFFALAAAIAVAIVFGSAASAQFTEDGKAYGLSHCQPYPPDTTAAEVQFTPTGIYNPGTTTEKVFCTLLRDQETNYTAGDVALVVYYRVIGAAPQRMTCTLFMGSTSMQSLPVSTVTQMGGYASGGGRSYLSLAGPAQAAEWVQLPNNLLCTIPPKVSMGAIWMLEKKITDEHSSI